MDHDLQLGDTDLAQRIVPGHGGSQLFIAGSRSTATSKAVNNMLMIIC